MNKKLYNLMDWARIEEVVYGECDRPSDFLGAHPAGRQVLVQCFFPGAVSCSLQIIDSKASKGRSVKEEIAMEMADEAGFFAALISPAQAKDYRYHVIKDDGERVVREIYNKGVLLSSDDEDRLMSGGERKAYEYMGAHKKTVLGVRGAVFRVYAPEAVRVSVVCESNGWNGLEDQMDRISESGIFELFLPGFEEGDSYKYEIVMRGGVKICKCDPFSFSLKEGNSVLTAPDHYKWQDKEWMEKRDSKNLSIYEVPLFACRDEKGGPANIKSIASDMAEYVKRMGFTHVMLMPFLEYPDEKSAGFHTSLFFAPAARFGEAEDYQTFVDIMHENGIGVIAEWNFYDFNNMGDGLGSFDGSALFEYPDVRRGIDPADGMLVFNLKDRFVKEYLLSSLDNLVRNFHIDGFEFTDVTKALYLDYYRKPGEWVPNIYGGVENLETIDFLKEANAFLHKTHKGVFTIAEDTSAYSRVTGEGDDSLGFDYKSDPDLAGAYADYLSHDPIERKFHHHELTDSAFYQYCESYIHPVSHSHTDNSQGGLYTRMFGDEIRKRENLKLLYAMLKFHVGSTSVIMGQEIGDKASFDSVSPINLLPAEGMEVFRDYICALNHFAAEHPALLPDTEFEWINEYGADRNILSFVRKCDKETLLFIFNFADTTYGRFESGVPYDGKYEMIFDTSAEEFGGEDSAACLYLARDEKCDGRDESICVSLKPLSAAVFSYIPYSKDERELIEKRKAEKIRLRKEEQERRSRINDAKEKIRQDLKAELEKKIFEAEEAIASGSEYKKKAGGKRNK